MVGERVDRLVAEGKTLVVLDLADVEQMDAMGLGEIVGAYQRARARGADLTLLSPPPRVGRLLSVTKLRTVIDVWEGGRESRTPDPSTRVDPTGPAGAGPYDADP
jgi:anti-sigma B factor antagonist